MDKELFRYIKEYCKAVPARWYALLVVLFLVVGGSIALAVWLHNNGLESWWTALYLVSIALFIVLSFMSFHKVAKERDELKKHETISDSELKLMESSKDYRKQQSTDDLPPKN